MIGSLVVRFLKGRWGSLLPQVIRAVAEGKMGAAPKAVYWWLAGYKTLTGAVLYGLGEGLPAVCANYPDTAAWACIAAPYVKAVGAVLFSVGLIDGGTRAPWPDGTPKEK